jgi:uncharacterized repeat protein (TIGR03803 family)
MRTRIKNLLLLLFLLALPAVVHSQTYTNSNGVWYIATNDGAITITGHTGTNALVTIPSTINNLSVTSIGNYVFQYSTALTSITIPNTITSIGTNAFYYCYYLTNVTIPSSVTSIGQGAFENSALTSVTISNNIIGDYEFSGCESLPGVTIPNTVTNIGQYAFNQCNSLTNITIPGSVISIGNAAFANCFNMATVVISNGVSSIGVATFAQCEELANVTIPGSVASIGAAAFGACESLVSVTIPNGVTSIGFEAFSGSGLTNIIIPNSVANISPPFGDCYSLPAITVSAGNSFYSSLNGVLFNKNQTILVEYPAGTNGSYAIPNSVTNIGDWAFTDCTGLTGITIPNSITSFGQYSFADSGLISITIPASVTSIGTNAFDISGVSPAIYIISIVFNGNAPSIASGVFSGQSSATVWYYAGTTGWSSTFGGLPTMEIGTLGVTTASLPNGTNGFVYSQTLTASGSPPPYAWTLAAGSLPPGLTLTTSGLISGMPTTNGTFNFTVKVTDALSSTATQAFSLTINVSPLQILHSFNGTGYATNSDGNTPNSSLILSGNTLYGTTEYGGTNGVGSVFAVNINGTGYTNLHSFVGFPSDGANPWGGLILSGNTLYGTTWQGGTNGNPNANGTVFAVNTDGTGYTNLHNFAGYPSDGAEPESGLVLSGNTLYGTTSRGGTNYIGTVFAIKTDGTSFTNLYSFSVGASAGGQYSPLILSGNTLYGTTSQGGTNETGTVFAIKTDGTDFTNLYSFTATTPEDFPYENIYTNSDGAIPGSLILSGNNLYGTCSGGGPNDTGTCFTIKTNGTGFTDLFFSSASGGFILSGNILYGTANAGGQNDTGNIFTINTNGTNLTNLYSFSPEGDKNLGNGIYIYTNFDGIGPTGPLLLSGNTLYGTCGGGGINGKGTIFSLSLGSVSVPLQITTTSLPNGTNGATYSQTLTASGGQTPYTWTNISGALPPGLYLSTNGVISGIPTVAGISNFSVRVTDAQSTTTMQALSLTISATLPVFQSAKLSNGQFMLTWSSVSNGVYQLQYKTNLLQTNWVSIGSTITASNTVLSVTNSISTDNQRFYRVQEQ